MAPALYLLEGGFAEAAIAAHGCIIGSSNDDGRADRLNELLTNVKPIDIEAGPITLWQSVRIVRSGFML